MICMKFVCFYGMLFFCVNGVASEFDVVVPIHNNGASAFYVDARFGSLDNTELLVDTGSGYVTISTDSLQALRKNGEAVYVKDVKGRLANGAELVVSVWRVGQITIGDECVIKNVEAAVFPDTKRQILGLNALKKTAPFMVSFSPPKLSLSACYKQPAQPKAMNMG